VESHGLLGSIQAVPFFQTSGIVNAGSLLSGAIAANVIYAGMVGSGLYQFNVTLPSAGDVLTVGLQFNSETQGNAFLPIAVVPNGL
jgi:uncharacterized protein (TIGR03437 family)